jgi:chromosome condensin MukBEF ATPase and DNA-binding subunit MukB
MDPRVKTPQPELVRQFELASKLAGRLGEVSSAMQQAGELRKQIEARKIESGGNSELRQALEALEKKIEAQGEVDPPLAKIAAALGKLLTIVDSADTAPTTDAATACEKWDANARTALGRWIEIQKVDIAGVNASLQKASLKPLKIEQAPKR